MKLKLMLSTDRIPNTRFWLSYTGAWEDVSKYDARFDFESRIRAHASVKGWTGGRVVAHVSYYLHKVDVSALAYASRIRFNPDDERGDPRLDTYLELQQALGGGFTLWGRYGLIHYQGDQDGRYQWYHLAKLDLEAKF